MKHPVLSLLIAAATLVSSLTAQSQTWSGNRVEILDPTFGYNSDNTYFSRADAVQDRARLRLTIGDEWSSDFQVGYYFYADGTWTSNFTLDGNGNGYFRNSLAIGNTNPGSYMLAVAGKIAADGEVRVFNIGTTNFPDYVFDKDYPLPSLEETEKYVKENHHLPEVPSAAEVEKNGMSLNEMNVILLKKVEELTLHLIEMKKENELLKARMDKMECKK